MRLLFYILHSGKGPYDITIQAIIDYRKAQVDFCLTEGSLLERRGANLPEQ